MGLGLTSCTIAMLMHHYMHEAIVPDRILINLDTKKRSSGASVITVAEHLGTMEAPITVETAAIF